MGEEKKAKRAKKAKSKGTRKYRVVDLPGTWTRAVVEDFQFSQAFDALSVGPVRVTLHLQPNEADPLAIAAYAGPHQIGWLEPGSNAVDRHAEIDWMISLDQAGIRPRFRGYCRAGGDSARRVIMFDMPGSDDDLTAIAARLVAERPLVDER